MVSTTAQTIDAGTRRIERNVAQARIRDRIIATREKYDAMIADYERFSERCKANAAKRTVVYLDGCFAGQWALDAAHTHIQRISGNTVYMVTN